MAVAGIARVSKAYWESVGYSLRDAFHLETKSKPLISEISRGGITHFYFYRSHDYKGINGGSEVSEKFFSSSYLERSLELESTRMICNNNISSPTLFRQVAQGAKDEVPGSSDISPMLSMSQCLSDSVRELLKTIFSKFSTRPFVIIIKAVLTKNPREIGETIE